MFTALVLAFIVFPVTIGIMKLAMRLLGWTFRVVFGVLLLPVWIVVGLIGCLAGLAQFLLPFMLVVFVISLFTYEA